MPGNKHSWLPHGKHLLKEWLCGHKEPGLRKSRESTACSSSGSCWSHGTHFQHEPPSIPDLIPALLFGSPKGSWITLTVNFHPAEVPVHWDCGENLLLPYFVLFSLTTAAHRKIPILRLKQLLKSENNLLSDLLWAAWNKKKSPDKIEVASKAGLSKGNHSQS